ncbi:MAG: hypothetical protein KIT17_20750 [Rubrivivax sp.]|nr:hypothetical protein [Rubrivivax sp.]
MQVFVEIDAVDVWSGCARSPDAALPARGPTGQFDDGLDPLAQLALADAADASLMRLVLTTAGLALLLALASSLASGPV